MFSNGAKYDETYDALGRIALNVLKNYDESIITKTLDYIDKASSINLVGSESLSKGGAFTYEYDALNRLTTVKENGTIKLKYTYDAMGRLTREDNVYANKSYTYDNMGNPLKWHNAGSLTWNGRKMKMIYLI